MIPVCQPFLNGNEVKYAIEAINTGWISSSGKFVFEFEQKFSDYCGCKYGVAVNTGTAALHLALVTLEIGQGDEVIIPTFTMIATAFAVCYTGAIPVFVDSDKESWNIDVNKIEEKITPRTKAIIVVHIFGLMAEMDAIRDIAYKYNLKIIEDAAEAHGAEYKGAKAGSLSDIGCFSFFANKIITTGEGGMVVTNSHELYNKARYFRNMCFPLNGNRNYTHLDIGFNYRMSNVIAAIGLAQTEKAELYKHLRINNNKIYRENLKDTPGIVFQQHNQDFVNVCWMNRIIIEHEKFGHSRDELMEYLTNKGIETRLFFSGMHNQKSLYDFGADCNGEYPVSNWLTQNGLYLPSASNLTSETIIYITDMIKEFHVKI